MDFQTFFHTATGKPDAYEYQKRLACGDKPHDIGDDVWLKKSGACHSRLISIPTGLGKTAAVVLAWLWNRRGNAESTSVGPNLAPWPRRLVYCLPMRTLVEQTAKEAQNWVDRLHDNQMLTGKKPRVVILMGGEELEGDKKDWDLYPEDDAILIGTQDMLLSRALNRGYGMSRYRWPMHFGLLNNDCLWVLDETQLMGVGVETCAQLDGFRHLSQWLRQSPCPTWWMSATLDDARLATVDHPAPEGGWPRLTLSEAEKQTESVRKLITAKKPLAKADYALTSTTKSEHATQLASLIQSRHEKDTLTLVVVNRVSRARELFRALTEPRKQGRQELPPLYSADRVGLIHSRFRPGDREKNQKLLFGDGDRIVVATQAVEAGVDVSARLLITELAPWSSLVQRFGRCNRRGILDDAQVVWVNLQPKDEKDDLCLPYSLDELTRAREAIGELTDAGPDSLQDIRVPEKALIRPVIRRRDLIDLFDTTPDICGQDLDISRYVRDGEDSDVQFFWRDIAVKTSPDAETRQPTRNELCRVPKHEAAKFIKNNKGRVWTWNALGEQWDSAEHARAGGVYLLAAECGGYDDTLGWTGESKQKPKRLFTGGTESEAHDGDPLARRGYDLSYADHISNVVRHTAALTEALIADPALARAFHTAALWHDTGKAHPTFQTLLCGTPDGLNGVFQAKSEDKSRRLPDERRGFRHELASALAWLASNPEAAQRDLIAYIIAAHHGKVRLSIRSLPDEKGDESRPERLFARGIWDGDELPVIPGLTTVPTELDLRLMQMGEGPLGPSWLARMIALRDRFGPFALAYWEALLRAADMRASAEEAIRHAPKS